MDTEKLNDRFNELCDELEKVPFDDSAKRDRIKGEIDTYGKLLLEAEKREQDRINSYTTNDINQQRIEVETEKVKADKADSKRRFWGDILKLAGSLAGTIGLGLISFKGEWLANVLKDRTLWDLAKSLKPRH